MKRIIMDFERHPELGSGYVKKTDMLNQVQHNT